jgi:hypothetical protein
MNEIGQKSGGVAFGIERLQGGKEGGFQHTGIFSNFMCSCSDDFQSFRFLGAYAFSRKASIRVLLLVRIYQLGHH